jgi:hypothetical protein
VNDVLALPDGVVLAAADTGGIRSVSGSGGLVLTLSDAWEHSTVRHWQRKADV